jgi:hypothetical protein
MKYIRPEACYFVSFSTPFIQGFLPWLLRWYRGNKISGVIFCFFAGFESIALFVQYPVVAIRIFLHNEAVKKVSVFCDACVVVHLDSPR